MTVAKAITDGVGGMGAMLASAAVGRSMQKEGAFYSTYGWHPRSVEIAIATLRFLVKNEKRLLDDMAKTSDFADYDSGGENPGRDFDLFLCKPEGKRESRR